MSTNLILLGLGVVAYIVLLVHVWYESKHKQYPDTEMRLFIRCRYCGVMTDEAFSDCCPLCDKELGGES